MHLIISGNVAAKLLHDFAKPQKLFTRVFRVFIRHRQMGRNTVDFYVRQRRSSFENVQGFSFRDAHAPHSGINLKIDGHRRAGDHAIKVLRFVKSGNRSDEPTFGDCPSFFRQCGSKDDDWMRERIAQLNRFFQIRDAE